MISVEEARAKVLAQVISTDVQRLTIDAALGHVLAEDIASDIDSPPHDKAMVDGYAVISGDVESGQAELSILEEVTAGTTPTREVVSGTATRIMTGAPIPAGADAVIMVEHTEMTHAESRVRIREFSVRPGQNIMRRATSLARGDVVLRRGHWLRGIEIGLLAEVGRADVLVHRKPRVAVLATGNELQAAGSPVAPGMIRNSNGPMLIARLRELGAQPSDLGIGRDDPIELSALVRQGLDCDVLLLSGGVSAGVLDLVPRILAEEDVEQVFHKINLKPGKPLWFGVRDHGAHRALVFGLPGNPVSSLVCFELFVRPVIAALQGSQIESGRVRARLATGFQHRGDRVTYHPARMQHGSAGTTVEILRWHGSADLNTLASANALACFSEGNRDYQTGDEIWVSPI